MTNYFSAYPGNYFTGDGARRGFFFNTKIFLNLIFLDDDGYYWITGRTDDLMNVCFYS